MRPRRVRRPGLEHHLQGLVEPLVRLLHGHAEAGELVVAVALADAEIEPASDSRSRVAACSASSTGLCQASTITAVPSRKVVVRAPTQVSRFRVADTWPKPVK